MSTDKYLSELLVEKDGLDQSSHACRLVDEEIQRIRDGASGRKGVIPSEDFIKLEEKVYVPARQFPTFNFIGKILGPRGNTLRQLQQNTQTRMSIKGRGSMRDKEEEEKLRQTVDPKNEHLKDDLHVVVYAEGPRSKAHARLAAALGELEQLMKPHNDETKREQMRELAAIRGGTDGASGPLGHSMDDPYSAMSMGHMSEEREPVPRKRPAARQQPAYGYGAEPPSYLSNLPADLPPGTIIIQTPDAHGVRRKLPPGARVIQY